MQLQPLKSDHASIHLPLNQAVQQANGAQFALMLSLLYEAQIQPPAASEPVAASFAPLQSLSSFNLENSLSQALQKGQFHQFNLLCSLYPERFTARPVGSENNGNNGLAEIVLDEVVQGYQPGTAALGRQAQKVKLAAISAAA